MKVAFRVDANHLSGFGHFSRCLNLYRTWQLSGAVNEVRFIGNYNEFATHVLTNYNVAYTYINCEDYSELYEHELSNYDAAVFDSYFITQNTIGLITKQQFKSILIDDECLHDYAGIHITINFRFDAEKLYSYNSYNQLLGKQYFVVRPEIVELRKANENVQHNDIRKVLMFLGGAFSNIEFIAELIREINHALPQAEVLFIGKDHMPPTCRYTLIKPTFDIENLLANADVVINGGGIIKYEASFALIPTASFSTTPLQYEDSKILAGYHAHYDLGSLDQTGKADILKNLSYFLLNDNVRKNMIQANKQNYLNNPTQNLINSINQLL
jgi:spore coat polysaccharide biosynthesis predicted glycosyltransferase SpsG